MNPLRSFTHKKSTCANFSGPVGWWFLALQRIGWTFLGPFEWSDQAGNRLHLGRYAPPVLDQLMQEAMTEVHEKAAADLFYLDAPSARVTGQHLRTFKASKTGKNALSPWGSMFA